MAIRIALDEHPLTPLRRCFTPRGADDSIQRLYHLDIALVPSRQLPRVYALVLSLARIVDIMRARNFQGWPSLPNGPQTELSSYQLNLLLNNAIVYKVTWLALALLASPHLKPTPASVTTSFLLAIQSEELSVLNDLLSSTRLEPMCGERGRALYLAVQHGRIEHVRALMKCHDFQYIQPADFLAALQASIAQSSHSEHQTIALELIDSIPFSHLAVQQLGTLLKLSVQTGCVTLVAKILFRRPEDINLQDVKEAFSYAYQVRDEGVCALLSHLLPENPSAHIHPILRAPAARAQEPKRHH